ncbi:hypothetical protein B0A55_02865 [Friedmanniomyces simplex]|uniref:WAC domain-containing protein n=1 Tax=Friedmanniomyces simplex TaxID=329884 RepID=A0A4V5NI23_9PEZI|nr:hypothetical protein B0A55_02865 [Friedmanniomyces simplex]
MVLKGRKPVVYLPLPKDISDNAEVFEVRGTGEVFMDYESYLKRYEWLSEKKFVDAVNGKSGLTFWEALDSEAKSSDAIENIFPAVLKDPILRKVQFSTIGRIDELVNAVYDEFKKDFFPGENVHVFFPDGEHFWGQIREKAKSVIEQLYSMCAATYIDFDRFPMIRGPDGTIQRPAFSRYFVRLPETENEALVDDKHLRRDKKIFTKQNLRSFLRNSLQREAWQGAPWLVKEHLAIQYRLPMEIPAHLMQDARLLASKVHLRRAIAQHASVATGTIADVQQQQMLKMKPPKGRRSNKSEEIVRQQQEMARMQQMQQQVFLPGPALAPLLMILKHPGGPPHPVQQGYHQQQPIASRIDPRPPPPPPVIRYPIEDLELPPKHDGMTRPQLSFFTEEQKDYVMAGRRVSFDDVSLDSMGLLLEVWNTLNVQCEVYVLDSFTFDDFVDAMKYQGTDPVCELLEEAHCAVLSILVDKNGKSQIVPPMRDIVTEVDAASSDGHDDSELSTPQPDVPAHSTRSRLSHVDLAYDNPRTPTTDKPHRAAEMLAGRGWKGRTGARDYEDGGWQIIVIGLLHQLSATPMWKARCENILVELAPIDAPATPQTAKDRYATLDVNLRISALQIITMLSISTNGIKAFLDACMEDMTDVRKRKIEHQREKKACMEELQVKDRDRKILWPQNMPDSPKPESAEPVSLNGDGDDTLETNGAGSSDPDDQAPTAGRSLRRASDRKRKRDEDTVRREKERAEKAEAMKEKNKQSKEFKKLLKDIEELKSQILKHEEKIQECDADLREANVHRTKMLGKDRFCTRYYWFERNGQPFGGLPTSSTADYGYANARLWVQGPDDLEADGFINLAPEDQKQYRARFGMTTTERRKKEEGATCLLNAQEWAFYDDEARLDNLIGWLDEKGEREKKLRKELCEWRDKIVQYMDVYKGFREQEAAQKVEAEEEAATRVSTRHKSLEGQTATKERCLKWTNGLAIQEQGHLHSQPEKKAAAKSRSKQAKGVATLVSRSTGKPVTRQGGSYNFK